MALLGNLLTVFQFLIITAITSAVWLIARHYYIRRRIFKWGRKLPGPKPWPIIGNAWHFFGSKFDFITKLKRYQGNHKLLALWFGHDVNVFLYSPEYAEIFCKSSKLLDRSGRLKLFEAVAPKGLILANGAEWKKARKLMESAMPYSALKDFIPVFENQCEILIERLRSEVGKPCFSILPYIKPLSFDIMSDISAEFELKAQKSEIPLMNDIDIALDLLNRRCWNVLHHPELLYKLSSEGKQFYSIFAAATEYADSVIIDRKEKYEEEKRRMKNGENSKKTRWKMFWRTLGDDETLTISDIRDHIFTMFSGGYETTSNAISCVLAMLALHQDVQERAYEEIITIADGNFNDEMVQQLEYLDMIVKETLRVFPSIPFTFRKATEDVQMGKYLIPAGADVSVNIFELHRDPEQYDNPHDFNPDNFLPENVAKRHPYSYIPFAGGSRKCVAGKLAFLVIKVVTAKLLLSYKFECEYNKMEDFKFRGDISLKLTDGGRIRILERKCTRPSAEIQIGL